MGLKLAACGALLLVALVGTRTAEAQHAARSTPSPAVSLVSATALSDAAPSSDDAAERDAKDPMGWASFGFKIGLAGTSAGSLSVNVAGQDVEGHIEKRKGLLLSLPINLGGDGLGWVFEPSLQLSSVAQVLKDPTTGLPNGVRREIGLVGLGGYMGPTFNFHTTDALYLGFGFGVKTMYLINDGFRYAYEAYGRVPLTATYYVSKQVALVGELGFGYGASVFANAPRVVVDRVTRSARNVEDDPQFGRSFAWDASFGIRLP